ncbi:TIGR03826 family flagellar region protein [Viridibacillus arvi]|uniref:TIGR03826 family flagellar region protein n=1 Tax=Viridibacillus arvi TaxID=263475 RepID=UPI00187B91D8|nr:TIGR03826 family flagellar region protein [Viridibacillus sp. JNUCC-6]QOV10503.1 hypothetical protein JNUCC6_18260 [Viridibacillus sp. JNUCC-6]
MGELRSCPKCGDFYNYTGIREVCGKCAQEEEKMYEDVYRFLRKRDNRSATIEQIVDATGVEEDLLHKWVRKGRLQPAMFPNLGYPCDSCGALTTKGKLCNNCQTELKSELNKFEAAREFRESVEESERTTYYADSNKKKQ